MTVHEVDCLLESMDSVLDLLGQLEESEWQVPSLCPAWQVRQVVSHLDGIEEALTRWRPSGNTPAPFEIVGRVFDEVGDWPPDRLLARFRAVLAGRRAELLVAEPSLFDEVSWTPVGVQTYGRFMAIRNFDFWVHEQDIRIPLGRTGHTSGPAAELALDEVRRSFGYIVGKRAGIPDGSSVLVELTGPIEAHLGAVVDGRARVVDDLGHPDAIVRTDFLTFMLLACGRTDPEPHLATGDVELQGNKELAAQLARNLRFTM
jgi:uncharacterized protein (TIGR03083 family)